MVENATVCVLIGSLKSYPRERQRSAYFRKRWLTHGEVEDGNLKAGFLTYTTSNLTISAVQYFSEVFCS